MSVPLFILKRILYAIPLLVIVSIILFTMIKLAPIDPLAHLKANPAISQSAIHQEELRLGLDKPPVQQYFVWLGNIVRGDLGVSTSGADVTKLLLSRAGNTLLLSLLAVTCTWLIAIPAGVYAAVYKNSFIDKGFNLITAVGMSTPTFFMALLLLMVALSTHWLPIGGLTSPDYYDLTPPEQFVDIVKHLVIPVCVLTFISLAEIQRQMRGNLLDVLRAEYVRTARAKGLPEHKVIYRHALRNAINPLITLLGFEFAGLLSGAALTETVLAYPGLGMMTLNAVLTKDINLVMAALMMGALMLIAGNLIADILLKFVDPRISLE